MRGWNDCGRDEMEKNGDGFARRDLKWTIFCLLQAVAAALHQLDIHSDNDCTNITKCYDIVVQYKFNLTPVKAWETCTTLAGLAELPTV